MAVLIVADCWSGLADPLETSTIARHAYARYQNVQDFLFCDLYFCRVFEPLEPILEFSDQCSLLR